MPSLPPRLPNKPASLVDYSSIQAIYKKAVREYLDRDFVLALDSVHSLELQPLSEKWRRKSWLIYLTILSACTLLSEIELRKLFGRDNDIHQKFKTGTIWRETELHFRGQVDLDVMVEVYCYLDALLSLLNN